jgi:hypothetical protein
VIQRTKNNLITTSMEIEKLIELYPRLYHMAERDAWDSIKNRGLMSTSAVLDYLNIGVEDRFRYESQHRQMKIDVLPGNPSSILLRDQKPMPRDRLLRALSPNLSPEDWYRTINGKVFFWVSEARLHRLLNARDYRLLEHDVITVDAAPFVRAYHDSIWLSHINSGNTWPFPHARGLDTFRRIPDYPVGRSGKPLKDVVELVIDYAVPDIFRYVLEVNRMKGEKILHKIL